MRDHVTVSNQWWQIIKNKDLTQRVRALFLLSKKKKKMKLTTQGDV